MFKKLNYVRATLTLLRIFSTIDFSVYSCVTVFRKLNSPTLLKIDKNTFSLISIEKVFFYITEKFRRAMYQFTDGYAHIITSWGEETISK